MAFCTECGASLPGEAMFCPNCGTMLGSAQIQKNADNEAQTQESTQDVVTPEEDDLNESVSTEQETQDGISQESEAPQASVVNNPYNSQPQGTYDQFAQPNTFPPQTDYGYRPPEGNLHSGKKKTSGVTVAIIVILSVLVLAIVASILFFRAIRNRIDNNIGDEYDTPVQVQPTTGLNVFGSGSLSNGFYHVSITGAEGLADDEGTPVIRVYYEFTNNFSYSCSAWDVLDFSAIQDGYELEPAYTWSDDDVYHNSRRSIRPGITIQCCYEFEYDKYGGSVDFSVYSWNDGSGAGTVTATYEPDNLPGPPPQQVIKPVPEPMWTLAINSEGLLDDEYYVSVLDAELLDDANGDPAIRVYYDFTNNSEEYASLYYALYIHTYQDGISLYETYVLEHNETDDNFTLEIAPGETIKASSIFKLRNNTSAVEAEVEAFSSYDAVGQTYNLR